MSINSLSAFARARNFFSRRGDGKQPPTSSGAPSCRTVKAVGTSSPTRLSSVIQQPGHRSRSAGAAAAAAAGFHAELSSEETREHLEVLGYRRMLSLQTGAERIGRPDETGPLLSAMSALRDLERLELPCAASSRGLLARAQFKPLTSLIRSGKGVLMSAHNELQQLGTAARAGPGVDVELTAHMTSAATHLESLQSTIEQAQVVARHLPREQQEPSLRILRNLAIEVNRAQDAASQLCRVGRRVTMMQVLTGKAAGEPALVALPAPRDAGATRQLLRRLGLVGQAAAGLPAPQVHRLGYHLTAGLAHGSGVMMSGDDDALNLTTLRAVTAGIIDQDLHELLQYALCSNVLGVRKTLAHLSGYVNAIERQLRDALDDLQGKNPARAASLHRMLAAWSAPDSHAHALRSLCEHGTSEAGIQVLLSQLLRPPVTVPTD